MRLQENWMPNTDKSYLMPLPSTGDHCKVVEWEWQKQYVGNISLAAASKNEERREKNKNLC